MTASAAFVEEDWTSKTGEPDRLCDEGVHVLRLGAPTTGVAVTLAALVVTFSVDPVNEYREISDRAMLNVATRV